MKKILIALILILICSPAICDDFTVRGLKWGISISEAKEKILDAKYISGTHREIDNTSLEMWHGYVLGMTTLIKAYFTDDQLYSLDFKFIRKHTNENHWIDDFYKIKDALIKKYDTPDKDHKIWSNKIFQNDPDKYGLAVSLGQLALIVLWTKGDTRIGCNLQGDNYKCELHMDYVNIPLLNKAQKKMEKIRQKREF